MKQKLILIIAILAIVSAACSNSEKDSETNSMTLCDSIAEDKDYMELTGTLVINSKGELVFKAISDDSLGIACPTFLIECGEGLNDYTQSAYDGYSSIRSIEDDFWIIICGKYSNLDEYRNQDTGFKQLEFVYTSVAIADTPEQSE